MRKVLTYGSFDLLHYGHINFLRRAKLLGDHLTVGLSTDEFNIIKGKASYFGYDQREAMLKAIRYVDEVFPETCWEQKTEDVLRLGAKVFVIGNDWTGKFDFLNPLCEVLYLARTPGVSTKDIKRHIC